MFLSPNERCVPNNYPRSERAPRARIWELDFLRGFTIFLMWIDHFMFDLCATFSDVWAEKGGAARAVAKFACCWWDHGESWIGSTRDVIQMIALCVFFGLCGGATIFSRDNAARAAKTMIAASIITLGTYLAYLLGIVDGGYIITFGVLHMLSFATLIVSAVYQLTRLAKKRADLVFVIVSALLAAAVFIINAFLNRIEPTQHDVLMMFHMNFAHGMDMGDYFPLIPNLGIAFAGAAVVTLLYSSGKSLLPALDGKWNAPFRFMGRHTLVIVIIHQVFNLLLLAVITALFVDFGNFVLF